MTPLQTEGQPWLPKAGEGPGTVPPQHLQRDHDPADNLILDLRPSEL